MVTVRFQDPRLRDSCASFLHFSFPGSVRTTPHGLTLDFDSSTLEPDAARAVVERLLWAWRTARGIASEDGTIIAATAARPTG